MKTRLTVIAMTFLWGYSYGQMDTFGSTTGTCDCYQITDEINNQAGSIWSPNSIDLTNSFDFTFDINLGDKDPDGADGLVFVIRNTPGAPGDVGDGIGYAGILNSIGVEVDTWNNAVHGDIADDHLGMNSNGEVIHALVAPISLGNVEDGANHTFRVTWDPGTTQLEVFFDDASMFVYTGDMVTDHLDGEEIGYFGWTGSTGGANNRQVVCSYRNVDFTTSHTDETGVTLACAGEEISFIDNSTSDLIYNGVDIIEWEWDFGDGDASTEENPSHAYGASGTYTVTLRVKDITGCFSETTITVEIGGIPLDIISNEPTCNGLSDGSIVVNIPDGLTDPIFTIKDADDELLNEDNSNAANNLATGWYYILVETESGCSSSLDSIFIGEPEPLGAELEIENVRCHGDSSGTAKVVTLFNAQGDPDNVSYFWEPKFFPGDNGVGVDSSYNMPEGEYIVTINDDNGCSVVLDFMIEQPDPLSFVELGFEPAFCRIFSYQNGNGVVFAGATGGTPDYNYTWRDLQNGDVQDNTTWGGRNPGDYEITATDENGCTLIDTVRVDSLNPIARFDVLSDQLNSDCQGTGPIEVEFVNQSLYFADPKDPGADTAFFWNLDTANTNWMLSESYFETFQTTYEGGTNTYYVDVCLVATNKNGCTDTACKVVTVYPQIEFTDLNIFTPNGDGKNDIFTFQFKAQSISEFSCVIVDRWGVVMAELNDISDGWDGTTLGGKPCKDGVYFYVYEATTDNNTKLEGQGNIQLISGTD